MFHPDQGGPEVDILVMSDAGAVGMNLQRGRWLVNYDVPLTYKTLAQRNARIDRIGQRHDVEVHNLVTDSKFDKDAVRRVQRKGLLQDIFESDWESMDDSGLAKSIALARSARNELLAA
jgi:SNF2 family DNA or RNA helicase